MLNRRTLLQSLAAAATLKAQPGPGSFPLAPLRPTGLRIGNSIPLESTYEQLRAHARLGVEYASTGAAKLSDATPQKLEEARRRFEQAGLRIYNFRVSELHNCGPIVLATPDRDRHIEMFKTHLRNCGAAGIHYITYAHVVNIEIAAYYQTGTTYTRGDIPTREFDAVKGAALPNSHGRTYTAAELWDSFSYFIRAVMPVAEQAGVRIGVHPDDPPMPMLGGIARIFNTVDGYRRAIKIANSPNFGICLCVGTWSEGGASTGASPIEMIREFGPKGKLFKIHFRNVDRPLPVFKETMIEDGYTDMWGVMKALRQTGFNGAIIPDHTPGGQWQYTLGYMKALRDRAVAEKL
ncbi:MAG: mannonate dehydratase [Bryobacterales bacterium]|nr:mannonate dehydratase [Bryobacterales bacterium]